ncbi:hypothetical protein LTR37_014521 [Vermiconidia calcicola]|uniref:Uncharacterized protein n=1 Tax=Vermiconidia calcicola TaxID=1690605 RepID=A0ACC3MTI7_9PEZI|nr:hypothetical protein LTR37_014521 [Vermiconidia calcicola]
MAGNDDLGIHEKGKLRIETPALASINYNSLIAQDKGTSSEDEGPDAQGIPAEDAQLAIGVSISHEQSRLTSPKTPAVEKVAAIERAGGFFGGGDSAEDALVEEQEDEEELEDIPRQETGAGAEKEPDLPSTQPPRPEVPIRAPPRTDVRLPSPWRGNTVRWQTPSKGRSGLMDGIFSTRRRAGSGPESTQEGWQRSFLSSLPSLPNLSSLPSLPKSFTLPSPFSNFNGAKADAESEAQSSSMTSSAQLSKTGYQSESSSPPAIKRQRSQSDGRVPPFNRTTSQEQGTEQAAARDSARQRSMQSARDRAHLLRRSTSDQSLVTQRTLSTVESLGDDSRFEHVQDQVNSRFKAIKDSWQDSNLKLPSLSNFNVSNFTPDFMRERAGPLTKKPSMRQLQSDSSTGTMRPSDSEKPIDPMTRQPYSSPRAAISDTTSGKATSHPHFHRALEQLEGDVVVLGGYRGSILRSAEAPHRQLWVPVKVGLNLRKADLEVGMEFGDDERATEKIIPDGMLTHIGPVDIARRLFKRLRSSKNARSGKMRVHDYGYDWRLDPNYLSKGLIGFLGGLSCNQDSLPREKRGAIVIAHSLGGVITRHAVNQRPELFRGIVYAGVPNTCVNILGPLRNGDEVLLSNRVLTAQVNFSIRTSFVLLPLDGRCFLDKKTREEYPVDFFDPQTWVDYRLSPCVGKPLPPLTAPPKPTGITGYVNSMASALPSLPGRVRKPSLRSKSPAQSSAAATAGGAGEPDMSTMDSTEYNIDEEGNDTNTSVRTAVTIPREKALEYLTRTLASVKKFKEELSCNPEHATSNAYPPIAVIYGKSTPTVYGAKVNGREGIKHADAYDELAFASGDGVVLARAAMVPQGYMTARGGVVSSERGHVTLLSDLEAVGRCLNAVIAARRKGVGMG